HSACDGRRRPRDAQNAAAADHVTLTTGRFATAGSPAGLRSRFVTSNRSISKVAIVTLRFGIASVSSAGVRRPRRDARDGASAASMPISNEAPGILTSTATAASQSLMLLIRRAPG